MRTVNCGAGRNNVAQVAIVMAAYNCSQTISEAIESIQAQTFTDWELIVVDDCSTDRTSELVSTKLVDQRIVLLRNERNIGAGASRNVAMRTTSAPLVAVMDSDDVSLPTRIEEQVRAFEETPECDVISTQIELFGDWGGPVKGTWPTEQDRIDSLYARGAMPVPHCSAMFRRERALAVGGYDEDCPLAEDLALFLKLGDAQFRCIPAVLLRYRAKLPLTLSVAVASKRYRRLANVRYRGKNPRPQARLQKFPFSLPTDIRSTAGWVLDRLR